LTRGRARRKYQAHPALGPAVQTLDNLMTWTDNNSDGWAYWLPPARAAQRLIEFIEDDGTVGYEHR
jgi:hypothetical protein